jgi:hypothetical protein
MKLGQTLDRRTQDAPDLELRLDDGHGWRRLLDSSAVLEVWTEKGDLLAKLSYRRLRAVLDHYFLTTALYHGLSRELMLSHSEELDLAPVDRLPAVEPGAWRSPIPDSVKQQERAEARRVRPRARKGGP